MFLIRLGTQLVIMCFIQLMMNSVKHLLFYYVQVLNLSQVTIGRISIGHIVNLASNDVQRFDLVYCNVFYCAMIPNIS